MRVKVLHTERFKRELLTAATEFYARRLRIWSTPYSVVVVPGGAFTRQLGLNAKINRFGPTELAILVGPGRIEAQLQWLAHEMVHARQLIKGRLVHTTVARKQVLVWDGSDMTNVPYHKRPWELEAMRLEVVLAHQFYGELGATSLAKAAKAASRRGG